MPLRLSQRPPKVNVEFFGGVNRHAPAAQNPPFAKVGNILVSDNLCGVRVGHERNAGNKNRVHGFGLGQLISSIGPHLRPKSSKPRPFRNLFNLHRICVNSSP